MQKRSRRLLGPLSAGVAGAGAIVLMVWPQAFSVQRLPLVAQLIAFRAPLALGLGILALIAATIFLLRRGRRKGGQRRRGQRLLAGVAVVLLLAAAGNGAVLSLRGSADALPDGDLTVLVWNTQGGATSPAEVVRLVLDTRADIVSLPETDAHAAEAIVAELAAEGHRMVADTTYGASGDSAIPTSVLIAERLGEYRRDRGEGSTPGLPSAVWRPVGGGARPVIVAAHPMPPLPGSMAEWDAGLRWLADHCDDPNTIVAGDFNATVDHMAGLGKDGGVLGRCADAAADAGASAQGTWPASQPAWIAAPIDHILFGSHWRAGGVRIGDAGGSDHRPVVATLTVP